MKEEMDATKWGDILADTLKDWAVPDVIENSDTYKRLAASSKKHVRIMTLAATCHCMHCLPCISVTYRM
jgi:hypothetical protein